MGTRLSTMTRVCGWDLWLGPRPCVRLLHAGATLQASVQMLYLHTSLADCICATCLKHSNFTPVVAPGFQWISWVLTGLAFSDVVTVSQLLMC